MSKVTPRILKFLLIGTGLLSMKMSIGVFTSFVQRLNSVADDFPGEKFRCCALAAIVGNC